MPPAPSPPRLPRPWRAAGPAWAVAVSALVVGVPPFLCSPPWADVTLYDVAARTVLRGGVHYRDVFDTNPPGMVWAHAAVRSVVGWSYEAFRAVDLLVVGAVTGWLVRWVRRCGAPGWAAAWFAAGVALFYPYTTEFSHGQRDVWMMLPAVLAAGLRAGGESGFWRSFLEGVLWGVAVWVKPHAVVPAAAAWLVGFRWQRGVTDALGLLAGGLLAGAAGVAWLVGSGAWPHFVDVFTRWNPEYAAVVWVELPQRPLQTFTYFRPWSLLHLAGIPVAVLDVWVRSNRPRAVLAAVYLGWLAQALLLQKGLDYVHVPETILGLAVLAARGWAVGALFAGWFLVALVPGVGGTWTFAAKLPPLIVEPHPATDLTRLALWSRCLREGGTPELRDRLGHYAGVHCATDWTALAAVEGYLRTVDLPLRDRELICWHDSTHPLYLTLDLEPGVRYLHAGTALSLRSHRDEIAAEVRAANPRFVVADLARVTWYPARAGDGPPDGLPRWLPESQRQTFPWDQPVAFRAGRYVVLRVSHPIGPVDIPPWEDAATLDTPQE